MEIEMYHYLWSFWFRLNNALLRIVVQQDKIRKCNRLSLPPLHKKDKRLENGLWDTIIFFQMKNNQANNAYQKSFDTICSTWLHSASWILHARRRPARISKLMNQKSKMHYFARIRWYPSIGDVQSCILSFIFATHFFFAVESSHTTIIENSHAIMIFFYADLEFDIDHDTRSSVQMSQPLRWFVKYPYVLFLLTVVLSVAGASAKWVYPPFTQYMKGVPRH